MLESSAAPPVCIVNSTVLPSGRNCGHRWLAWPCWRVGSLSALPPAAEIRHKVALGAGENTIVSSGPHVAPRDSRFEVESVRAAPPVIEIFFRFGPAKKPIHWLSGEKNGVRAPSVPGINLASSAFMGR